jgi:hypothetical protein
MKGRKTGGRQKGTPNKDKPERRAIKQLLQLHSLAYITPGPDGVSDLERDLVEMEPAQRAAVEVKLLEFHTPKMQATSVDARIKEANVTIEDRLIMLCHTDGDEEEE